MAYSRNKYPNYRPKERTEFQAHKVAVMAKDFAQQNLSKSEIDEKLSELDKEIDELKSRVEGGNEPFKELQKQWTMNGNQWLIFKTPYRN